jgi:hypothetical protein
VNRVLNLTLCASLALGGLVGCSKLIDQLNQKKKAEAMLASASALASAMAVPTVIAPATVATPAAPGVSDAQIPAPEDFEQAAGRDITDANAQAELDKLKKDIGP